jgi:hypothetical protein
VIASAAVVVAVAAPAQATVPFSVHQRGYQAVSYWQLGDRHNTFVSIDGSVRTDQIHGGKPVPSRSVIVDIAQSYCDTAHDQWVDRFWHGSTAAPVSIVHNLTTASWPAVPMTLTGDQYNTPLIGHSCGALDWEHSTTMTLRPAQVSVGATFTTSGHVIVSNSSERVRYDPWFYVTINHSRARMASAVHARLSTSSSYLTALRTLPVPDFAFVGHNNHTEITITRGHVPGGS